MYLQPLSARFLSQFYNRHLSLHPHIRLHYLFSPLLSPSPCLLTHSFSTSPFFYVLLFIFPSFESTISSAPYSLPLRLLTHSFSPSFPFFSFLLFTILSFHYFFSLLSSPSPCLLLLPSDLLASPCLLPFSFSPPVVSHSPSFTLCALLSFLVRFLVRR